MSDTSVSGNSNYVLGKRNSVNRNCNRVDGSAKSFGGKEFPFTLLAVPVYAVLAVE